MQSSDNTSRKYISKWALFLGDLLVMFLISASFYSYYEVIDHAIEVKFKVIIGLTSFILYIIFLCGVIYGHYTIRRSFYDEFSELLYSFILSGVFGLSLIFIFDLSLDRYKHIEFILYSFLGVMLSRLIIKKLLNRFGLWKIDAILIGRYSELSFAKVAIESQFNIGMKIVAKGTINYVEEGDKNNIKSLPIFMDENSSVSANLLSILNQKHQEHFIIALGDTDTVYMRSVVDLIARSGCDFSIIPDLGGASVTGMQVTHFFRWEQLMLTPKNSYKHSSYIIFKRLMDICICLTIALCLMPLFLCVCFLIKFDGGSVFYFQNRIGLDGKEFKCWKFRSMKENSADILNELLKSSKDASEEWAKDHKLKNDPRITKIGKIIRKYSIDELPQLYNIIVGDMSLVGPRPITRHEIEKYGEDYYFYKKVRPGLTGVWQISGRSNTSYEERVRLDVWYIKNWSVIYDVAIIINTIVVVFSAEGSY